MLEGTVDEREGSWAWWRLLAGSSMILVSRRSFGMLPSLIDQPTSSSYLIAAPLTGTRSYTNKRISVYIRIMSLLRLINLASS